MFDIGGPEFLLILVLGLLVFGPRRLPRMGKQLGGFLGQLRRSVQDFQGTLEREVALDELRDAARDVRDARKEAAGAVRDFMTSSPTEDAAPEDSSSAPPGGPAEGSPPTPAG